MLREHRDDEQEQQLAFGTEDRVKASTGAVNALERPEEAFQRVGGRGEADTPTLQMSWGSLASTALTQGVIPQAVAGSFNRGRRRRTVR